MIVIAAIMAASVPSTATTLKPLQSAAACVIRKDQIGAADLAFTEPGSSDEASAAANLKALARCSNGLATSRVADGVALQLFNETILRQPGGPTTPEEEARLANSILAAPGSKAGEAAALDCLVTLRPQATGDFVRARPGSSAEQAALKDVIAAMPRCVPTGAQVKWAPVDFRLGLARAAYRKSGAHEAIRKGD